MSMACILVSHGVAMAFLPRQLAFVASASLFAVACGSAPDLSLEGVDAQQDPLAASVTAALGGANITLFANQSGYAATYSYDGAPISGSSNPFFASLGTNGRTCATCHVAGNNWGLSPAEVTQRFGATKGLDPIFRTVDGANAPNLDVSTVTARKQAYSMLLSRGVIRVGLPVPPTGELELVAVDDPYHYASARELSLFRRPLPSTNLAFLTATMWDGRESTPVADPLTGPNNTVTDLANQANDATLGHAQGTTGLTPTQAQQIVAFEAALYSTQVYDNNAGPLIIGTANRGPVGLASQTFYFGINDVVSGDSKTHAPFDPNVFSLYTSWNGTGAPALLAARASIQRGEAIFNSRRFTISGVGGVNDVLGVPALQGSCTTCHDAPNVGNHSVRLPLDLGLTTAARRTPQVPLYTFCKRRTDPSTGAPIAGTCDSTVAQVQTTDPGRALITGKWAHMNLFKGPILRGVAARAPYFHDGSAAALQDVVSFYNKRFTMGLSARDQADLVAFLSTL
jgi:cytochrome c peroxidase